MGQNKMNSIKRITHTAIKRKEIGSSVDTWVDLESVIQSEVSQKEKNKYRILMHACGIWENGTDEPGAGRETQMWRVDV